MVKLSIGLDFDGVIANTPALKSVAVKEIIGKVVKPEEMLARNVIEKKLMTMDEYHVLQREVYFKHPQWHNYLHAMSGAIEGIEELQDLGHFVACITSRTPDAVSLARQWIEREGIEIEIHDMEGHPSKTSVAKELGLNVFIDDDPQYLEPMIGEIDNLFLYSWVYNKEYDEGENITRTGSWSDIMSRMRKLSEDVA
jgi:uncharacterized protein